MNLELDQKTAIVTGSSRGLGLASAIALAKEGCFVTLCARGALRLEEAASEVRGACGAPDRIFAVQADVATPDGACAVVSRTVGRFGGLDILVNNVGLARGADLLATTDADWQEAFDQTLFPAVRVSRAAVPHMRVRGGGVILMIASIFGRETGGRMTYNAVKAAEISLAKSLAQQLAADNIRVNSIAPGSISVSGGIVVEAAAIRSREYCRVRETGTPVRALRVCRRGGQRRRVPCVTQGQLDFRRQHRRGWLPVAVSVLRPCR